MCKATTGGEAARVVRCEDCGVEGTYEAFYCEIGSFLCDGCVNERLDDFEANPAGLDAALVKLERDRVMCG
jgi:hypothetical protein